MQLSQQLVVKTSIVLLLLQLQLRSFCSDAFIVLYGNSMPVPVPEPAF
jgi:hypothetical protein